MFKIAKKIIPLAFISILFGGLLATAFPFVPTVSSQDRDELFHPEYFNLTWVADNQINVAYRQSVTDPTSNVFICDQTPGPDCQKGTYGIFTDSDPFDSNVEFRSGQDHCDGGIGGGSQSKLWKDNNNGVWHIELIVDPDTSDAGVCDSFKSTTDPPGGDVGAIRDQGYWIDRTRVRYKNAIYKVPDCNVYTGGKSWSGEQKNTILNEGAPAKQRIVTGQGNDYLYTGGPDLKNNLITNIGSAGEPMYVKIEDNKKFIGLNVVEDGYKNSATMGYKLDEDTILVSCGIKNEGGLGGGLGFVDKALYKRVPEADRATNSCKATKFFRVGEGNMYFQDWVEPKGGDTYEIIAKSGLGDTGDPCGASVSTEWYNITIVPVPPPADVYGDTQALIATANNGGVDPNPDSTTGEPNIDCEVQLLNPLTWLMCPLIEGAKLAVETLDNAITTQLTVNTEGSDSMLDEQNSESGKALFNVWAAFRYIALGILVIIGLIMIISQALSFGMFDAYTIKKILPKILIGIIGISISWYLCKFAVDIFNDLGSAVRSLLYGPFRGLSSANIDAGAVSLLGIGAGVAVVGLGVVGILSFVATALLAVIIAFAILTFRRILIVLLVVTAPVAIVCWILPNTQKVWSMWWDFFIRALVVFPIIALFISGGRVIAQIATAESTDFLNSCIAFIAYFGPYFALPAAFRLAGGAIATLGGIANDRSRGVFDRLKKGRQERFSDRMARAKNENLYNPNNRAVKALRANKAATWIASPHKNLQYATRHMNIPGLSAQGRRLESDIHSASMEQSEKWLQHVNKHGANDKFYRAVGGMYHGFSKDTQDKLVRAGFARYETDSKGKQRIVANDRLKSEQDFHRMADILATSDSDSEVKAAEALHANAAYTAGLYTDADMNYANTAVGSAMGLAAHSFFKPKDARDVGELIESETGSRDFAHAAVVQAEVMGAKGAPDAKAGYGHTWDQNGNWVAGDDDEDRSWGVLETFEAGAYQGAKGDFLDADRQGGRIRELITAGGPNKAAAKAVQDKWRRDLMKMPGMTQEKAQQKIERRLSQRNAIIGEVQQLAGNYSQGSADGRAKAEQLLKDHGLPINALGVDPEVARGGGGGDGGGGGGVTPPAPDTGGINIPSP